TCTFISSLFVLTGGINSGRVWLAGACTGGNGIFMSNDQGASWTLASAATMPTNTIVFSLSGPADGSLLRASTVAGVYYSSDFGVTWTQKNGTGGNVLSGPNGASVILTTVFGTNTLALSDGNGVFCSGDGGTNWIASTGLPASANLAGVSVVGTTAYAFVDGGGVYKSVDNGQSWSADSAFTSGGLPDRRTRFIFREGAGPVHWAGTSSGVYKSTDNGASWTKTSSGLPGGSLVNAVGITGAPQTFCAAADTVYKSTDGGFTWTPSDSGLGGLTFASSLSNRGLGSVNSDPSN